MRGGRGRGREGGRGEEEGREGKGWKQEGREGGREGEGGGEREERGERGRGEGGHLHQYKSERVCFETACFHCTL